VNSPEEGRHHADGLDATRKRKRRTRAQLNNCSPGGRAKRHRSRLGSLSAKCESRHDVRAEVDGKDLQRAQRHEREPDEYRYEDRSKLARLWLNR